MKRLARTLPVAARFASPYVWQPNSTIRAFEYPWAFAQVEAQGHNVVIADVGASLGGLQFTLAQQGHTVHAIDPGLSATGKGWDVNADLHSYLSRAHRAPVTLHATTLDRTDLADQSLDVILSISTLEHFGTDDFASFAAAARRVLKPTGVFVLTVDLFLNLTPFTTRERNRYGVNVNVATLLDDLDAVLVAGDPSELHGFSEFDADRVQSSLSRYMIGQGYPALAQCLVAAPKR